MAKLTLDDLLSLANQTTAIDTINANNAAIEAALENTLSRDGTSPNAMEASLDMNSNRIINLPAPVDDQEPVRLAEHAEVLAGLSDLDTAVDAAEASATAAAASASSAASSASAAAASAAEAATFDPDLYLAKADNLSDVASTSTSRTNLGLGTGNSPTFTGLTLTGALAAGGGAVFNEDGANVDFRIEGDTDANLIFADASAEAVGIGLSAPVAKLGILGGPGTGITNIGQLGGNSTLSGIDFSTSTGRHPATGTYSILGGDGNTYINAATAGAIIARINNTTVGQWNSSRLYMGGNIANVVAASAGIEPIHIVATDGNAASFIGDSFATNTYFTLRRANGTAASKTAVAGGAQIGAIAFDAHDGTTYRNGALITANAWAGFGGSDRSTYVSIHTTPQGSTTVAEALRITDGRQALIGADGTASAPAYSRLSDPDTGTFFPAADTWGVATGGTERIRVNSSGQLGVGVSPSFTLDVAGTARIGASPNYQEFGWNGTEQYWSANNGAPLAFFTSGAQQAQIDAGGRLLLGYSSVPASNSTLCVKGVAQFGQPTGPGLRYQAVSGRWWISGINANNDTLNDVTIAASGNMQLTCFTSGKISLGNTTTEATITGLGFKEVSYSIGTVSSGTTTPDAANGNKQHYTNGGAHTLAPPSASSTLEIEITNNGSAGSITTSGFTKVTGDSFTTTNGHKFACCVSKTQNYSYLNVIALQ